jgi:hypothetical protein
VELRKYGNRLQNKLGETKSADRIVEESWWAKVVKETESNVVGVCERLAGRKRTEVG